MTRIVIYYLCANRRTLCHKVNIFGLQVHYKAIFFFFKTQGNPIKVHGYGTIRYDKVVTNTCSLGFTCTSECHMSILHSREASQARYQGITTV